MAPPLKYNEPTAYVPIRIPLTLLDAVKLAAFVDGDRPVAEVIIDILREKLMSEGGS